MAAEYPRRTREPRSGRFPAAAERIHTDRPSGRHDDRGGIHRVADGHETRLRRRPGLQLQVEHGLDERYAVLLLGGPVLPQGYARQDHLLVHVCLLRKLYPAALA